MKKAKEEGFKEGNKWTSKYLYHIPLVMGFRRKKKKDSDDEKEDNMHAETRRHILQATR